MSTRADRRTPRLQVAEERPVHRQGNRLPPRSASPADSAARSGSTVKLTEIACQKILRAIVDGRLDLGEPLSENDLARALRLSKAPIRESLSELRLKGLVVVVPQSGSYVFSPSPEEIAELCDFRSLLETRALRASMDIDPKKLIAELRVIVREIVRSSHAGDIYQSKRLDTEFHHTFIRHCGNRYLIQSYANIRDMAEALRHRFMDTAIYRNRAYDEHRKMVDLLASHRVSQAIDVLEEHIARTKHFQTRVTWPSGRQRRRDYKFRDYATIFSEE